MSFAAAPLLIGRHAAALTARASARVPGPQLLSAGGAQRSAASAAAEAAAPMETYSVGTSMLHWAMAGGILTCFGTVQASINSEDKTFKGQMMTVHKSVGLLMAGLMVPRLGYKLLSKAPGHIPGAPTWEKLAADVSHNAMYVFMVALPASGIAMGYFGGKGLPFFGYNIPGASAENKNGKIAGNAFKAHKKMGQVFEFLVPAHLGGVAMHYLKGQAILARVNPFASRAAVAVSKA